MPDWLTVGEAKEEYNLSKPTLYRWIKNGKIVAKMFGSNLRVSKSSLDNILARKEHEKVKGRKQEGSLYLVKSSINLDKSKQENAAGHIGIYAMELFDFKNGALCSSSFSTNEIDSELETTDEMFAAIGFKDNVLTLQDRQTRTICEVFGKNNEEFFVLLWLSDTPTGIYISGLLEYINFLRFIQPVINIQAKNEG